MNVLLYGRPTEGYPFVGNITNNISDWERTTRAIGGYWSASFSLHRASRAEMIDFYNRYLGYMVQERDSGLITWEGIITEMRLVLDDVEYVRTLDPEWFHNRVAVIYSSGPLRKTIPFSEDTESLLMYGSVEYIVSLAGATDAAAAAMRDRHLKEFAWPRSRMVGPLPFGYWTRKTSGLHVMCLGFWSTLNWKYHTTLNEDTASNTITALVNAAAYVRMGNITSNSLSVRTDGDPRPIRLGDAIADVIEMGDASGNIWRGGVYAERLFNYEPAPTDVEYEVRNGVLYHYSGTRMRLAQVLPGKLVHNANAPMGWPAPGTSDVFHDPKVNYIEAVTFRAPDELSLQLYGKEPTTDTLRLQIARGARDDQD